MSYLQRDYNVYMQHFFLAKLLPYECVSCQTTEKKLQQYQMMYLYKDTYDSSLWILTEKKKCIIIHYHKIRYEDHYTWLNNADKTPLQIDSYQIIYKFIKIYT